MSILSQLASFVRSTTQHAAQAISRRTHLSGGYVDVYLGVQSEGLGDIQSLAKLAENGRFANAVVSIISDRLLQVMRDEAGRFSSTGELADSFRAEYASNRAIEIVSDVPYATTWLHDGWQGSPPTDNLIAWMQNKGGFSESGEGELRDIAWAIRRTFYSSESGVTGQSTLRKLDPVGERYYDYVQAALDQIGPELNNLGGAFRYL